MTYTLLGSLLLLSACSAKSGAVTEPPDAGSLDAEIDAAVPTLDASDGSCAGPLCNSTTGRACPLSACSAASPCTVVNSGKPAITDEITLPSCKTSRAGRAVFDDGAPMLWTDTNGEARAACTFFPPAATASAPRPLVVYITGSLGSADDVYNYLSLRAKAPTSLLGLDAATPGFVLASLQPRNLHWLENGNPDGPHEDYVFRDMEAPGNNPDVRSVDALIDKLVASGKVNPKRIYVTGWSNGALFGQLYAIVRHAQPTPMGNSVAAAAIYAGADPFNNALDRQPSCQLATYPSTTLPLYVLHRDCDALMACNSAQQTAFKSPPGINMEEWLATLSGRMGDTTVTNQIIDAKGSSATACSSAAQCPFMTGFDNHTHWPDGIDDMGGSAHDWEPAMLAFLRAHPWP